MTAINEKKFYNPSSNGVTIVDNQDIEKLRNTNSMLSDTIAKQEMKNNDLHDKIQKLKALTKSLKYSMASQCKFCHSFYPTEIFEKHYKTCLKEMNNFSRSHFF
jgi:hypothetical protein